MTNWPDRSLGDLCGKGMYGLSAPGSTLPVGPKFLRTTDMIDGRIDWDSVPYCEVADARAAKSAVLHGDLVISRTGANAGAAAYVSNPPANAVFAGYLVRFRADESQADARFLGFVLRSSLWNRYVSDTRTGSAQPQLNAVLMGNFRFPCPPLDEQRRIAGVLGALDDLIEIDRRLADNLRRLTGAAFERLQMSATEPSFLRDVLDLKYGRALPAPTRRPGQFPVVSSAGIVDSHDERLVEGPGVAVGRKGTVGSVTWVDSDFFPIDTAFYVESELPMLYVYWLLKAQPLSSMNTDSAVPGLSRDNALALSFQRPDASALREFIGVAMPLWDSANQLDQEVSDLGATRDELLPLLMSGRVRVSEVAV